jgi:fructokinase
MTAAMRIGIDLGGTKIAGVALHPDGSEVARIRRPTPRSYVGTLEAIAGIVSELDGRAGEKGTVGLGIPGALSPSTGLVRNANSTWLIGRPLDVDLQRLLDRPVRIMNDANCFALSEASDGAGAGARCVFGVILGTGVGGGIVLDGAGLEGASRIAGEWGHNPLPAMRDDERPGPACYCGRYGCVETFLSGPGLAADHQRVTGEGRTAPEVVDAAVRGEPAAAATLDRYVDRLARALGVVVNILDPDVIVLGGGVSNMPGLPERVQAALPPYVFTDDLVVRVVRHRHGDASGVRGAAWLWGVNARPG